MNETQSIIHAEKKILLQLQLKPNQLCASKMHSEQVWDKPSDLKKKG